MSVHGRRRTALLVASALAAVVLGLGAEWLAHGTRLAFVAQRDLLVGWATAGCGIVAWAVVPRSRIGPLLVAAGLAWFIGTVGDPSTDTGRLARALTFVYAGLLAHVLFTWPGGRVERPLDLVLVGAGYLVALFPPLWDRDSSLVLVGAALAVGLLVQHATMAHTSRRSRRPALVLGLSLAATLALKGRLAADLRDLAVAHPADAETLWQIALVVVVVGLTWSLVVLDRRRQAVTDLVVELGDAGPVTPAALADELGLADDESVREALRQAEDMAARNAALRAQLSVQVEELAASRRRLLEAGDQERAALEERLRLGAAGRLARLEAALTTLRPDVEASAPGALPRLDRAFEQLRHGRTELEEVARGLDPGLLTERGLAGALRDLATRSPVPVMIEVGAVGSPGPSVERTLYYVASEALVNVARHARATNAWLVLRRKVDVVELTVEDDGTGGADPSRGSGLRGLRDRLDALDGRLVLTARPGGGTQLRAAVPFGAPPASA